MVTTTSMTTVSVSTRKAQSTCMAPEVNQVSTLIDCIGCSPKPTEMKATQERIAETNNRPVVTSSATREPGAAGSTA